MRNRLVGLLPGLVFVFLLIALAVAGPSLAQQEPKPGFEAGVETAGIKFDTHDLSGIFVSVAEGAETIGPNMPPLTAEGKAKLATHISADRVTNPALSNDPQFGCNPQGFPRLWFDREGIENIHLPDRILQLSQWEHTLREIWMDGRAVPSGQQLADLGQAFYGHSVGKWQADTLIVTTVGLDDRNWIDDDNGYPISSEARFEERYRRLGPDVIAVQYTLYDPKYYTAPWVGDIKPWRRLARERVTHYGWYGLFSGVTEAICAPINEEEYHKRNAPAYVPK